jgi:hypothetical protein
LANSLIDYSLNLSYSLILDIYYLMALQSYKLYENSSNVKIPRKTAFRKKQNIKRLNNQDKKVSKFNELVVVGTIDPFIKNAAEAFDPFVSDEFELVRYFL